MNKNKLVRNVDQNLWTAAKHRALDEGITLSELIHRALRRYLGVELTCMPKEDK